MWIISTTTGWIGTSFVTYIHGPQMMNHVMTTTHGTQRMTPPYCGDPLTFPLPPPAVQSFTYSVQYFNTYLTFTVSGWWILIILMILTLFLLKTSRFIFVVLTECSWIYFYNLLESVLEFFSWIWLVILYSFNFLVTIKSDGSFPSAQNNCPGTLW